ncbi:hypothetical protein S40288_04546 [Stachybotrys chartarum IBT 40288]|nr:hypothetical protein S40288_04546 [Stachybotrys chartarum IBT 40288]
MAFYNNSAGAGGSSLGPELETIETDALGFHSLAGEAKVRLTSPWSPLPSPTASLLSVASRRSLVAAAGPDQVILATTEAVRKAFEQPRNGDSEIREFEPQLKLSMPMRISQLAFTADENYLILSAENGGGLAVYEVQSLLQGSTTPSFELPTNGEALRSVAPNPTPEKAELCAVVTQGGNLHMANLKDRSLSSPLKTQVSCVCWSSKGKQLCAGLGDGTISQLTPEGEGKGDIPKPPDLGEGHVSSLGWLENNLFLVVYKVTGDEPCAYYMITRQPPSTFTFQKMSDPVPAFGSEKPPHHSILRLRDFPPNLQDLLIVSSTASPDIGLLARSKAPLAEGRPAESITGVFTTVEIMDNTRRPTLPMTDSMEDSTPIGISLDLSGKEKVYKPIPSDEELEESPGPLPGLWVLTHEGLLCSWWLVYVESIKQGSTYPGMAALGAPDPAPASAPAAPAPAAASPFASTGTSTLGSSAAAPAFGASSQLGQKSSPWATAAPASTSTGSAAPTFGSSTFGNAASSASPAFGKPSAIGFGQSSQLGMRTSPWSSAGASTPAFGQSAFSGFAKSDNNQSPFASAPGNQGSSAAPSSAGFAGFANKGGFSSVSGGSSVLGSGNASSGSPFGSGGAFNSSVDSAFVKKEDKPAGSLFGSQPFKLQSSFKPDTSAQQDSAQTTASSGNSLSISGLGSMLNDVSNQPAVSTPTAKDEDMDTADAGEETPQAKPSSLFPAPSSPQSTTPTSTPAPHKFTSFGAPSGQTSAAPASQPSFGSSGGLFGSRPARPNPFAPTSVFDQKQAPGSQAPTIKVSDDAPLPPDTTSKAAYLPGDSSSSSAASNANSQPFGLVKQPTQSDAAPLPPDFLSTSKTSTVRSNPFAPKPAPPSDAAEAPLPPDFVKALKPAESSTIPDAPLPPDPTTYKPKTSPDDAPLPPDFITPKAPSREPTSMPSIPEPEESESDLDEGEEVDNDDATEGSGVDVAKELSPGNGGIPGLTPSSSFGGPGGATPTTIGPAQDGKRSLFGEVSRNAPLFPRPTATSPRSPSPVRGAIPNRILRTDATRSVSAPGMASHLLGNKMSQSHQGSYIGSKEKQVSAEDPFMVQQRKLKARQEAEERQPLVDEEDDEVQKILASEVESTLTLDEFIAHSNVVPPAKESVPSQVEAVYRDINSMIDTFGLNLRAIKAFIKGQSEVAEESHRTAEDLERADDWVLCEIDQVGEVIDNDLYPDLEDSRVQDLDEKLEACQALARDMQRLRAKQEDLRRTLLSRMDPDQVEAAKSMPLSVEQATQQNELRREYTNFAKLLAQAEEALTLLKTRIASVSSASGKGNGSVPTVDAIIRTIGKMTAMVEKRSGDIDVLENELRKVRLSSTSREGSPMVTPQSKRSIMYPLDSTPSRSFRRSLTSTPSGLAKATPPRKKLSGFSKEEKGDLMEKRARRQAVLGKLKDGVAQRGVGVWTLEDIE